MWDFTQPISGHDETMPIPGPNEPLPEVTLEPAPVQQNDPLPASTPALPTTPLESVQISDDSSFPPLDPEVLSALGEATEQGPTWGDEVHNNLSQLWQPLLKKGMTKENKDKILKQYLIPSNCTLLQAPKLNIEISAAIVEMIRLRDKKVETNQQQLGLGITAISRAMTSLLTTDNKIEAIKTLSDGCRILCDLHHVQSQARIKMITPGLAKPFLNVIQDSERDETLFGSSLPDKIKASKTIEKQGLQIKKTAPPARPSPAAAQSATPARQQFQGNWTGPPRYSSNRGGRGGQRKFPSSTRRNTSTTATASAQPKANYNRPRAPTR